jgi:hypothetical protein
MEPPRPTKRRVDCEIGHDDSPLRQRLENRLRPDSQPTLQAFFRTGWKIMVARRGGTRANVSLSKSPAAAATTDPVTG